MREQAVCVVRGANNVRLSAQRLVHFGFKIEEKAMAYVNSWYRGLRVVSSKPAISMGLSIAFFLCAVTPLLAQLPPSPALDSPLIPFGSFTGGDVDAIAATNASLSLNIPLISFPQRGGQLHAGFFIGLNPTFVDNTLQGWGQGVGIFPDFGVYLNNPAVGNVEYQTLVTPDNASHNLGLWTGGATGTVRTRDATGFLVIEPSDPRQITVIDRKGIRYTQLTCCFIEPISVEDPNGNKMAPQYNLTCTDPVTGNQFQWASSFLDTMGRNIPFPPPYPSGCTSPTTNSSGCTGPLPTAAAYAWTLPGISGGTYTIKICYAPVTQQCRQFIQSVVLPNGTTWTFQYDLANRCDLTEITFPTGGTISYSGWYPVPSNSSTYCDTPGRSVGTRTVDANDGTGSHVWSYSSVCIAYNSLAPGGVPFPTSFSRTITDPQNNQTVVTLTELGTWGQYYESQAQHYQLVNGSQTLLSTTTTNYSYETDNQLYCCHVMNIVPSSVTTSWPDGTSQKTTFQYDPGTMLDGSHVLYGDLIQKNDYDSMTGPILRQTNTTYMAFSGPNASSYLGNNLLDLAYTIQIVDGANQQAALTQYNYDESTPASSGIGTSQQHDLSPPNANYRGNRTSLLRWLNSGSLTCPNGHIAGTNSMVLSKFTFFDTGTQQTASDPCGNQSIFAYDPAYWGAYLTTVTNALSQSSNMVYDFNTGRLTSSTDANGQITSRKYNDPLLRLTETDYPDGGKTIATYNDTAIPPNLVLSELISGSISKTIQTNLDGLGRATEVVLTSDPQGAAYTAKIYDSLGRIGTVYNPTRCNPFTSNCGESTWGSATHSYDALGRITSLVEQDGSAVNTSYSGRCATVADEAGKSRKSCVDGLGRVTRVFEDPSGLNYETDYQYDALGNLLCSVQKGTDTTAFTTCAAAPATWRRRSFTYDSLSRLTSASNPESGTIQYTYDANGNLTTKTAPSPNQPSNGTATVTTTYTYDPLNRLSNKSYKDTYASNPATASVIYGYDSVVPTGCTPPTVASPTNSGIPITPRNTIGRRSSMCDGSGATAWIYDSMGRPTIEERTLNGVTKNIGYVYNLDGEQKYLWYPSDNRMNFNVSAAGRTIGVTDEIANYVFGNALFTPGGALTQMTQYSRSGSYSVGFDTFYLYNQRLQRAGEVAGYNGTFLYKRCYDYHLNGGLNIKFSSDLTCTFTSTTPGDNGNVYELQNQLDDTRSQNFVYDSLNRIQQAYTNGSNWGQQFTIDAWGNLTAVSAVSGKTTVGVFTATASTKNQLSCTAGCTTSYDAAGNTLTDGNGGITYDAENRILTAGGVTYTYDGDGKRVKKSNGMLYWTGVGSDALSESDLSGNINEDYVFFDGKRVSRRDVPSNTVHSFLVDHLGSSRMIVVASGTNTLKTEQDVDYTPYGVVATGTTADPYQFNGKEYDSESGLNNFGARYDAATLGRFMTPDWAAKPTAVPYAEFDDPQSLNLYSYVKNHPTINADLDGHGCPPICGGPIIITPTEATDILKGVANGFVETANSFVKLSFWADQDAAPQLPIPFPNASTTTNVTAFALPFLIPGGEEEEVGTKAAILLENKAKGLAFQETVAAQTAVTDSNVVQNITLKTKSGVRTVMDVVSNDANGNVALQEAKSSATAPLTTNQALAHPEIEQSGATIVGKGKEPFTGGTEIPPTKVKVVRPRDQD